jgi:adenylate cyclase
MSETPTPETAWPELRRAHRAIVVVDVVESVRLMQQHEADVIDRWRHFVNEVAQQVLPMHEGRLVKSLGDGMLLEFAQAPQAVAAALELQQRVGRYNAGRDVTAALFLRIGVNLADIVVDELDVYGAGVNLAARLSTLAGPAEIVVSAAVRDELLPGIDAQVDDLGDCELRGVEGLVRAYRLSPSHPGMSALHASLDTMADVRPAIAVLPLTLQTADPDGQTIAELIASDVTQRLSTSAQWRVISRLSSMAYRGRRQSLAALREQLRVDFVVSGSCLLSGNRVRVTIELADAQNSSIVWSSVIQGDRAELTLPANAVVEQIVSGVAAAIIVHEVRRSRAQPMPTLRSYTLLFAAVSMMHRLSRQDFERSQVLLTHLADRHRHSPEPQVWLAKWHVMRVVQGWSESPQADAAQAQALTGRALDWQSDHALALAIDGLVEGLLKGDLDAAERRYDAALASNPNESLAWLFMSALHTYQDRGDDAVRAASTALSLSPLDPMRYFFDGFAANAMLAAGQHDDAIALARQSIRANCTHLPVYRAMAIAQVMTGRIDEARRTVTQMLKVQPGYSLAEFERRYAGRHATHFPAYKAALRSAGLPDGH